MVFSGGRRLMTAVTGQIDCKLSTEIFLICWLGKALACAGFTVLPAPAQGLQPTAFVLLHVVGWREAGLFSSWMVVLVKTQRTSVSNLLSALLSPFPSHSPPFSFRAAYVELCFEKMVSDVQNLPIFGHLKHAGVRFTYHLYRKHVEFTAA